MKTTLQIRQDGIWWTVEPQPMLKPKLFPKQGEDFFDKEKYDQDFTRWEESFCRVEDQELAKTLILMYNPDKDPFPIGYELTIDLDWEMLEQFGHKIQSLLQQRDEEIAGLKKYYEDKLEARQRTLDANYTEIQSLTSEVTRLKDGANWLLGKVIRYRYVDWEDGSFTPWSPCTESDIKKFEDRSLDIIQIRPDSLLSQSTDKP